ncbi:hypothetical protein RNAN_2822 [Rheinheimera nanhaiensis E407-8]|uniref:Uncharacterized protein n=1 Tax=Rheinheimera nanhaiensis E407-8 TaxID=562729 RepID=I1E0I1_9GAMM|nr:hypothetical protein RNAN_2822 [Rheinheimera nanhaiensis E407-8]
MQNFCAQLLPSYATLLHNHPASFLLYSFWPTLCVGFLLSAT